MERYRTQAQLVMSCEHLRRNRTDDAGLSVFYVYMIHYEPYLKRTPHKTRVAGSQHFVSSEYV